MSNNFSSKALEANLARTRNEDVNIPTNQRWFVQLSKSKWGIHKRAQDFITELNHKYVNYNYVIESLHNISLNDLWFYYSLEESDKANSILVDIFEGLFNSNLEENERELLIKTLIKYMDRYNSLGEPSYEIISRCFNIINKDMEDHEQLYIRNSGYFKSYLNNLANNPKYAQKIIELSAVLLEKCIDYWERTSKVEEWFKKRSHLFHPNCNEKIKNIGQPFFEGLRLELRKATTWEEMRSLFFFNDISKYFRSFTEEFNTPLEKIYFINYLLHLPGMIHLYDHLLYDMNRHLRNVLKELKKDETTAFLDNIMALFEELKSEHGGTVLDCILTLGKEVIDTKDQALTSYFVKGLIKLGFYRPGKLKINDDWQIQINNNHIKNIRVWLELIQYSPYDMRELLAALIVNLKLGGIFISDTDLFQRDVTSLLNSDIGPVYREIKQLARIFPVYFREIGAEGELREATTAIDELSRRKDRLIHFLRKQTHTESNNTHIYLTKSIIKYWCDGDKERLKDIIPEDVYEWLSPNNEWFKGVHEILIKLRDKKNLTIEELLDLDLSDIKETLNDLPEDNERDKDRVYYLFQTYSLLLEKYSLESEDIISMLNSYGLLPNKDIEELEKSLEKKNIRRSLENIYRLMNQLKEIILDSKESKALENIYYKRHIAVGIPSMYGQYIEPKFDALGLMYRLERTASKLMVELLELNNYEYITAKTFRHLYEVLVLFKEGLELDGIYNQGFNSNLEMFKYSLTSPSFTLDQYIDLFRFMAQNINQIIDEYFLDLYEVPLNEIIPQIFPLDESLSDSENKQRLQMESEKFLRDNLYSAFLLQDLDNFITSVIDTLRGMIDNYSDEFIENMLSYDPDLTISPLNRKTVEMDNPVFLGAKAYFLKKLISYNFPVPPGFVLTSEVFRHKETVTNHPYMRHEIDQLILKHITEIEKLTNSKFGNPNKPLLFSVRSGTSISLPGAMKTFLNVGLNDEIVEVFSRKPGYEWTAWDCYRRFLQSWGMAYGVERDIFDDVMNDHKIKYGIELKVQFSAEQMRDIAYAYKKVLEDHNINIQVEPFQQLTQAILCVLDSWYSESAKYYREHMDIADDWGTAVIVQKMILGNLTSKSGTGVVFTNSPFNGQSGINLYGDFALCSQGEDVVSGLVNTLPITEQQRKKYYIDCDISLESELPRIYEALLNLSTELIDTYGFMHQEIEFTFESDDPKDLYILQTRNQNLKKQKTFSKFVLSPNEMKLVGRGIGVGRGALSGIIAFDMDDIEKYEKNNSDEKIILVRPDTVPDDIPLIFRSDGLITAKGGATSHAAITAATLGKICIVSCKRMKVNDEAKICEINGKTFKSGDKISIDANLGNVYEGNYEIQEE